MDWNFAIEKHKEALKRVLAMLVAMAGLGSGGQFTFFPQEGSLAQNPALAEKSKLSPALPRHLHRAILRLLRAAEAAARRLIVVAARGLVVLPGPQRHIVPEQPSPFGRSGPVLTPSPKVPRPAARPTLPLIDPLPGQFRRRHAVATAMPRISVPGWTDPAPLPARPTANDLLDATSIHRRLAALVAALDDLPRQARRLARWRSRRPRGRFHRVTPLRGGRPPGWRKPDSRRAHPIHPVLHDLHGLAFWAQEKPDTS